MIRLNKNKAITMFDEIERGMISKLADRCNSLEPMETRTCKAGDFTLIAKKSDLGDSKEIHLMAFYEPTDLYEYVADAYVSATMDKSNYYQFLFNSVSNYKRDQEMIEEAIGNAKTTATQFVSNYGSRLGKIITADQGQFSINSKEDNPSVMKIRGVATITYAID